jgi:hypothetical protein
MESYLNFKSDKKDTDITDSLHQIANQIHRRGLVVLFTDFFEKNQSLNRLFDAVRHLKHQKHEVIIFHMLHKNTELDFNFGNLPLSLKDAETGEIIKLLPQEVKGAYLKRMTAFNEQLVSEFHQYKIDYVLVDTAQPVEEILLPFLMKRKKMR